MARGERGTEIIRILYERILAWHKENGVRVLKTKGRQRDSDVTETPWFRKYLALLEGMPEPEAAEVPDMVHVAREIVSGCMEFSYWEEIQPGLPLNRLAHQILEISTNIDEVGLMQGIDRLNNLVDDSMAVTVSLLPQEDWDEAYHRCSEIAYRDVRQITDVENLGGVVALADTNLEHERHVGQEKRNITFRNAKKLHLVLSREEDCLASLAVAGVIDIESVRIGVRDVVED